MANHNHAKCVEHVMLAVQEKLDGRDLNLTPIRKRVLEILLESHDALGAYAILEKLSDDNLPAQPPVAYRALDYLMEHGLVHKIEHLNAFVACTHPHGDHIPSFMICKKCNVVAETPSETAQNAITKGAIAAGFRVDHLIIEALGTCPNCRSMER